MLIIYVIFKEKYNRGTLKGEEGRSSAQLQSSS